MLTYFSQTPQVEIKRTPGYDTADYTGRLLNLYDIVQVFATEQINGETWYMIGPDEWVPGKFVARVLPNPTPPAGVTGDRWIEVNLFDQTLAVYDQRRLVFATLIASGAEPFWTRPGVFQIFEKHEAAPMTGAFEGRQVGRLLPGRRALDDVLRQGARAARGILARQDGLRPVARLRQPDCRRRPLAVRLGADRRLGIRLGSVRQDAHRRGGVQLGGILSRSRIASDRAGSEFLASPLIFIG